MTSNGDRPSPGVYGTCRYSDILYLLYCSLLPTLPSSYHNRPDTGSPADRYAPCVEDRYLAPVLKIDALLHLGQVEGGNELAVYVKSRGAFTRFYMAAIWPFRHFYI